MSENKKLCKTPVDEDNKITTSEKRLAATERFLERQRKSFEEHPHAYHDHGGLCDTIEELIIELRAALKRIEELEAGLRGIHLNKAVKSPNDTEYTKAYLDGYGNALWDVENRAADILSQSHCPTGHCLCTNGGP